MSPWCKGMQDEKIRWRRIKKQSLPSDMLEVYSRLLEELQTLQNELVALESEYANLLQQVNPRHLASATNLVHYMGLRRKDMRSLQERLAAVGLSSLGRAESHVLPNLKAITTLLERALQRSSNNDFAPDLSTTTHGSSLLRTNACNLLGEPSVQRQVRILVTLPKETADDYVLVKEMLERGMDCARINCAHDDLPVWSRIIENIKHARRETGRHCRILIDLGGPKLRTGEITLAPAILKWQPHRDVHGHVVSPARIWLHSEAEHATCPTSADACLPIKGNWLERAIVGDQIVFTDTRGAERKLKLVGQVGDCFWAESNQTSYLMPGLELHLMRVPSSGHPRKVGEVGKVGDLPQSSESIRLYRGDNLVLTSKTILGCPAQYDKKGQLISPAIISCSLPEIFTMVKPGERILFDDGRIGGVIKSVSAHELMVEITQARDDGEKLLSDKGINLPDSQIKLSGLTEVDIEHLAFVVAHADMVGLSFAHCASDIQLLQQHLKNLSAEQLGIVLKVETRAAFENLPELLFTLLRSPNVGVMIARGDLAVECGYERLAELQEEIMWLAEASHLPLIWATQVLEGLTKHGKPSRAEITDAAMGERAECVMLNKGPHILEAIQVLDDILRRMQGHQNKKSALLRRLHW